jgi:integrase
MGTLEKVKGHAGIYKVLDAAGSWSGAYKTSYRINGRQHWKTFSPPDALSKAEKHRAAVSTRREEGTLLDPRKGRVSLESLYVELHAARDYAAETLMVQGVAWRKIEATLGHRYVNQIDKSSVEAVLDTLRETPSLQEKARNLLSVLFKRAIEQGLIREAPMPSRPPASTRAERKARGSRNNKPKRILNDDELQRLADEIEPRYRALIIVMGRMGLRPGEAVTLAVGKFMPPSLGERGRLLIDTALSGFTKTGESRELVLPDAISEVLRDHIARFSDSSNPDAPIFTTSKGLTLGTRNRYVIWARTNFTPATVRAGVNHGLTPNDLRHTAAAWMISLGGTVYDVQRALGHSKPSITLDVYGQLWEAQHADLVRRQDEALGKLVSGHPVYPTPILNEA